jgi:phosphatidate cytidylyltransferase
LFHVRVLTAAALLAGFLGALLLLGREVFAALVAAVVALAASEWAALAGLRGARACGYAAACTALYAVLAWAWWPPDLSAAPLAALFAAAAAFWILVVPAWLARGTPRPLLRAAGFVVLAPAALAMAALPPRALLALLGLVWIGDTAAYFAGRRFGRRKLAPAISPGKTWEGAAGAALASLAYAMMVAAAMPEVGGYVQGAAWFAYLAGTLLLCAIGIVGDLFESALKRQAGAKDSGRLLPGHGGVLDRIDSATAVLPVGALLLAWTGAR